MHNCFNYGACQISILVVLLRTESAQNCTIKFFSLFCTHPTLKPRSSTLSVTVYSTIRLFSLSLCLAFLLPLNARKTERASNP
jgi:hypothetical protein